MVFSWFGDAGGQGRELEDEFDAARFFIRLVERDVFVLFLFAAIAIIAAISCIVFDACRVLRDRNKRKSLRIKGLRMMGDGKPYRGS